MNSISSSLYFLSFWNFSRLNNFFSSFSWDFFYFRSFKFYYNYFKSKKQDIISRKIKFIRLISYTNSNFTSFIPSSFSRSYYDIINRSKFEHFIFWSKRRRGSSTLPTLILIFWTPRSIHSHFTWIWFNFSYHYTRKK